VIQNAHRIIIRIIFIYSLRKKLHQVLYVRNIRLLGHVFLIVSDVTRTLGYKKA
jgi:hypothetical protein